jgi:hypothetical protein
MVHNPVDLGLHGTEAFETWEDGIGTVLWVTHDRSAPEDLHALREELNKRRSPNGRYDGLCLKVRDNPNADWSS